MGGFCTQSVIELPDAKSVLTGTQIPEWVSAAGRQLYEQAGEMASSAYPMYSGPRIASYNGQKLTPEELSANRLLSQGTSTYQPYIDRATAMSDTLGQGYDQASRRELLGADYSGMSRDDLLGQYSGASRQELIGDPSQQFSIDQAQPFLDIYQQSQDAAVNEVQRQTERANIQNRATAARSGAFGGSRLGIQEGLTAGEGARAAGDLRAQAGREGLSFAAQQFEQDRQARFGAENLMRGQFDQDRQARFGAEDTMRSQYDQDRAARFGAEDSRRAGFETQEASRLRASENLQGYAPLVQGLTEQAASGMLTAGQARRQLDQMALDLAYSDYVEQREYPFQMINFALGALQGVPYETRTIGLEQGQQYVQNPSIYGQTIGGLGSLASAYYLGNR
jgi:hypothetical protein